MRVGAYLLIGVLVGAGIVVLGISATGVPRPSVSTTTVTSTPTPGPDTSIAAPDDAVQLTGCSVSNNTCIFQITNFNMVDGFAITLGRDDLSITLTYTSPNSISSYVGGTATSFTASPSSYVANNGGTTTLTAVFPAWGGGVSGDSPTVGESVHGCILYTSGYGFGCLAFAGVFTP